MAILRIGRQPVGEIVGVHPQRSNHLLAIIQAIDALRLLLPFREHREEQSGEDANNGDDNQQLDQRKGRAAGLR